jgi:hypothetical protein
MSTAEDIRLHYPLPIAKLYEAMQLEREPRQRVRKLVDLYERTAQYLALAGLAHCARLELQDPRVEALRSGLERPSLGHWVGLLKMLSGALRSGAFGLPALDEGEVDAESLRFRTEVALGAVSFDEGFALVERGLAEAIVAGQEARKETEAAAAGAGTETTPTHVTTGGTAAGGQTPGSAGPGAVVLLFAPLSPALLRTLRGSVVRYS